MYKEPEYVSGKLKLDSNKESTQPLPLEFTHIYGSSPIGKRVCIYAMDNWESKSVMCGKIIKNPNPTTGKLGVRYVNEAGDTEGPLGHWFADGPSQWLSDL